MLKILKFITRQSNTIKIFCTKFTLLTLGTQAKMWMQHSSLEYSRQCRVSYVVLTTSQHHCKWKERIKNNHSNIFNSEFFFIPNICISMYVHTVYIHIFKSIYTNTITMFIFIYKHTDIMHPRSACIKTYAFWKNSFP